MALIELCPSTAGDIANRNRVFDLVKIYFHLNAESLERFNYLLFHPKVDEIFVPYLDDEFRIIKKITDHSILEYLDDGWRVFNYYFEEFISKHNITYYDFQKGIFTCLGEPRKLFKFLLDNGEFYIGEKSYARIKSVGDGDIHRGIKRVLDEVGAKKSSDNLKEIVLSFNFVDWFLSSTAESWSSCLNLNSNFASSYWAGLPGLIVDFNRCLMYTTDTVQKFFSGIVVDRIISRSWCLLNEDDGLSQVKLYPTGGKSNYLSLFDFKQSSFMFSKYPIDFLYDNNDNSIYIFQDSTSFDNKHLISGGKGFSGFTKDNNVVFDNFIRFSNGLDYLINNNISLNKYLIKNKCKKCNETLYELRFSTGDGYFCEECYENEKKCCCVNCGEKTHEDETHYYDGDCYCVDCFDENFFYCHSCGDTYRMNNAYEAFDNLYCETCFYDSYSTCENCGTVVCNDGIALHDDSIYCQNCFDDLFKECSVCHEYFETLIDGMCEKCKEESLSSGD